MAFHEILRLGYGVRWMVKLFTSTLDAYALTRFFFWYLKKKCFFLFSVQLSDVLPVDIGFESIRRRQSSTAIQCAQPRRRAMDIRGGRVRRSNTMVRRRLRQAFGVQYSRRRSERILRFVNFICNHNCSTRKRKKERERKKSHPRRSNLTSDAIYHSGFTCKGLEYLEDEFRGKARIVWSVFDGDVDQTSASYRPLNTMLAYKGLAELADIVLPLSVTTDGIGRDLRRSTVLPLDPSPFTGASVLALQVDSVLSSLKLKLDSGYELWTLPKLAVAGTRRKFVISSMSVHPTNESKMETFSPKCSTAKDSVATYAVTRASNLSPNDIVKMCGSRGDSTFHASLSHPSKFAEEYFSPIPLDVVSNGTGLLSGIYALHNSREVVHHFDDLLKRKFQTSKMHRLNVAKDDVDEAIHELSALKEHYCLS